MYSDFDAIRENCLSRRSIKISETVNESKGIDIRLVVVNSTSTSLERFWSPNTSDNENVSVEINWFDTVLIRTIPFCLFDGNCIKKLERWIRSITQLRVLELPDVCLTIDRLIEISPCTISPHSLALFTCTPQRDSDNEETRSLLVKVQLY